MDEQPATEGPGEAGTETDMEDVFERLDELAETVDTENEREQVAATRRTLRQARRPGLLRFRDSFDFRDAGEALLGSFLFGIPMIVEDGTLTVGRHVARSPLSFAVTALLGLALVYGIFRAANFERIEEDFLFGVIPLRLLGVLGIATSLAVLLLTLWGRVSWAQPVIAAGQTTVVAIVMAVGASLGDILPER